MPARLVLFLAAWLFGIHAIIAALAGIGAYQSVGSWTLRAIPGFAPLFPAPPSSPTPLECAIRAALWPYSWTPPFVPSDLTLGWTRGVGGSSVLNNAWTVIALLWALLTPVGYLILGQTFRLARLRWLHLLRIGVYSAAPILAVMPVYALVLAGNDGATLAGAPDLWWVYGVADSLLPLPLWLLGIVGAHLAWTWLCATRHYLRLPHPIGVALVMVAMSGLGAMTIMVMVSPEAIEAMPPW